MKAIFETQKDKIITNASAELKKLKEMEPPVWADIVKTGVNKQRPPSQEDWWYIRSASVLMKVMKLGPVGVSKLRVKYGGKKRRGHKPAEFRMASGNVLRKILQKLEKAELVKQEEKAGHKGRVIAPKGVSLLNTAAKKVK